MLVPVRALPGTVLQPSHVERRARRKVVLDRQQQPASDGVSRPCVKDMKVAGMLRPQYTQRASLNDCSSISQIKIPFPRRTMFSPAHGLQYLDVGPQLDAWHVRLSSHSAHMVYKQTGTVGQHLQQWEK